MSPTLTDMLGRAYKARMMTRSTPDEQAVVGEMAAAFAADADLRAEAVDYLASLQPVPGQARVPNDPQTNIIGHVHSAVLTEALK